MVTFTDTTRPLLQEMMQEDYKEGVSSYLNNLISDEYKRRQQEKYKRNAGRPRKDGDDEETYTDEDLIRNIPHPDTIMNEGRMINRLELKAWEELKSGNYPQ